MPQACRDCGAECQDWGDGSGKRPEELPGISREWETDSLSGGGSQAGSAGGGRSGIRQES